MSNALAIATVTAVLKDILENGLTSHPIATSIGDTLVTALPPDRVSVGTDERPQLNVFLYQVSQNRNADWVGRDRVESHRTNPLAQTPLALDLHYLLTAYGAKDFQAELLLGYAMQLLHDIPVLTRDRVYAALKNAAAMSSFGALSQVLASVSIADLADQVAPIKLGPEFFSMEETSKLWSSLQTHYRPSAGYQASMVLIESRRSITESPVPGLVLSQPVIEQVGLPTGLERLLTAGDLLVIRGKRLQGTLTRIRLMGRSTLLTPQDIQDNQISLVLPLDLAAGVQAVQVVNLAMNPGMATGQEIESNVAAFVVHPTISASIGTAKPLDGEQYNANITLGVKPLIGESQQVILWLHPSSGNAAPYRFSIAPRETATETLTVPIQVKAGTYWVQLQVDGAPSAIPTTSPSPLQVTIS